MKNIKNKKRLVGSGVHGKPTRLERCLRELQILQNEALAILDSFLLVTSADIMRDLSARFLLLRHQFYLRYREARTLTFGELEYLATA